MISFFGSGVVLPFINRNKSVIINGMHKASSELKMAKQNKNNINII
jgi:hypothetical protein